MGERSFDFRICQLLLVSRHNLRFCKFHLVRDKRSYIEEYEVENRNDKIFYLCMVDVKKVDSWEKNII